MIYFLVLIFALLLGDDAFAVTRYADGQVLGTCLSGNYSIANRNCTGSDGDMYGGVFGLQNALNASAPGDTVIVRSFTVNGGIYLGTGRFDGIDVKSGPSFGTDCSNCTYIQGYGGGASSTTPGCAVGECPRVAAIVGTEIAERQYVFVKNIIIDGSTVNGIGINGVNFSRFENVTVTEIYGTAINGFTNDQFINMKVHNNGWRANPLLDCGAACHGIYTGGADGILIDGGEYSQNQSYGLQVYPTTTNSIVKNVKTFNNGAAGIIFTGTNLHGYNIIAYGNGTSGNGNGIHLGTNGLTAYGLTSYDNAGVGICIDQNNITVRNSISVGNRDGEIVSNNCNGNNYTATFTQSHNIVTGGAEHFANAVAGDFRLCTAADVPHDNCTAKSPAVDAGMDLGSPYNVDIFGNTRNQSWDIGAIESDGEPPPPGPDPALVLALSGDGITTDESGESNNGSLVGGATYTSLANGKYNQSFLLDGVNDSIDVADSDSLDPTDGFTISAWVYPLSTITTWSAIVVKNYRFFLYAGADGVYCGTGYPFGGYFQGGVARNGCQAVALAVNTWTFLSVTWDGANIKFGVNGSTVDTEASADLMTPTTGTLQIGASQFGEFFHGRIDNIRLYNYARSDAVGSGTCDDPGGTKSEIECDMDTPILPIDTPPGAVATPLVWGTGSTPFRMGAGSAVLNLKGAE